jgi:hypothetical protein
MMSSDEPASTPLQTVQASISKAQRQYQQTLDRWTPHMLQRWLATLGLLALFMLRIVLSQGVSVRLIPSFLLPTHSPFSGTLVRNGFPVRETTPTNVPSGR